MLVEKLLIYSKLPRQRHLHLRFITSLPTSPYCYFSTGTFTDFQAFTHTHKYTDTSGTHAHILLIPQPTAVLICQNTTYLLEAAHAL